MLGMFPVLCSAVDKGASQKARLASLWGLMQDFYQHEQPHTRLGSLVLNMLKRPGEPAKLRAKAGETRCLVPFAWQQASRAAQQQPGRLWDLLLTAIASLHHLSCMVHDWPWPREVAVGHVRCLVEAWTELGAMDAGVFRVKPLVTQIAVSGLCLAVRRLFAAVRSVRVCVRGCVRPIRAGHWLCAVGPSGQAEVPPAPPPGV